MGEMTGKTVLVTGATNGIGKETARALAKMGARIALVARDEAKGRAVLGELERDTGNPDLELYLADLSSQAEVRRLAAEIAARHPKLDVLVNNAGGFFDARRETVDGLEYTFALNHLAYFLLTNLLLPNLRAGAPSRIVNVSSEAQAMGRVRFDDLNLERRYGGWAAYAQSKLANVMFTYELARRLAGTGVTANVLHPGQVATGFGVSSENPLLRLAFNLMGRFSLSAEQGADTVVYLASSPRVEGVSGLYFEKRTTRRSSLASYDEAAQRRLWDLSAQLTGLPAGGP